MAAPAVITTDGTRGRSDHVTENTNDGQELANALRQALTSQARSALHFAVVAGSATGSHALGLRTALAEFAAAEVEDTQRLVETLQALGVLADVETALVAVDGPTDKRLARLVADEDEAIRALHGVIPHAGEEARSEAIEHLMEHLILRKQRQVDTLRRVLDTTA